MLVTEEPSIAGSQALPWDLPLNWRAWHASFKDFSVVGKPWRAKSPGEQVEGLEYTFCHDLPA